MFTGVEPRTNRGIGSFDVIQPFIQPGWRRKETKDWGHLSLWFKMMPEMWCLQHVKVPKMEVIAVITRCLVNGHDSGTNWLEVPIPYIFLAYFLGLCKGIYPQNMVLYGTNVPPCIGSWRSPIEEMFCAFNMFQHVSTKIFVFFRIWKAFFEMMPHNMPLKSLWTQVQPPNVSEGTTGWGNRLIFSIFRELLQGLKRINPQFLRIDFRKLTYAWTYKDGRIILY